MPHSYHHLPLTPPPNFYNKPKGENVIISIKPPQALVFPGSRATYVASSIQATYKVTQGPQALCDLRAAWSRDLCEMQLHKPLC